MTGKTSMTQVSLSAAPVPDQMNTAKVMRIKAIFSNDTLILLITPITPLPLSLKPMRTDLYQERTPGKYPRGSHFQDIVFNLHIKASQSFPSKSYPLRGHIHGLH